ncbi:SpoIVB peptidase [Salipaludibacillus agaradhaerens]|uniref:SpoIVB peptidase n=1 Tax=Salipaludibacillus agaradhaerens TaxID=76935 RepID=UPI0021510B1B|nr:SpoIVB peptidase [Salipaludibacillus agaradhaerens]MCR6106437.1 SpoIVB peptidase [Salipaludibacillus agaradhaerens]MCR6118470.1 SpoIVB peptidase [Salipaludibacillus agaradhaerens]
MNLRIRKITGILLLVILFSAAFYPPVQKYLHIPHNVEVFEGQTLEFPEFTTVFTHDKSAVTVDNNEQGVTGKAPSKSNVSLQAMGLPIKSTEVTVYPELKVIPGGQSIGVRVHTDGVLVVGYHLMETDAGKVSPGEASDIRVGDSIIKMNGKAIEDMSDVQPVVQEAGKNGETIKFEIKRNGRKMEKELTPVKGKGDQRYHLGLYIRDSAAGVGTLTFYEPESKKYGALGHVISDMETKEPIEIDKGEIIRSNVTSIEKGLTGEPGEKLARFSNDKKILGDIAKNTQFGIFGTLKDQLEESTEIEPLEIGLSQQVKEGPAEILTVVEGDEVKRFNIDIISSTPQESPATKGMVIKVTDKELLDKTGGIVQGMSGSPIIQNDKIIGAVTHVFVNDPSSGYGCHIEWMLNDAGIDLDDEEKKAS